MKNSMKKERKGFFVRVNDKLDLSGPENRQVVCGVSGGGLPGSGLQAEDAACVKAPFPTVHPRTWKVRVAGTESVRERVKR